MKQKFFTILAVMLMSLTANAQHEYVDLGLPSGTLWATCNIGANSPEEYGDYFAWGETEPKSDYSWETYKWCKGSFDTMTKYCNMSGYGYYGFTDTLTELLPEDDAATANLGSGWQMPSKEQWRELFGASNTTIEWTQENGVNGEKITSVRNGNSIFIPAAGYRQGTGLYQTGSQVLPHCYYWCNSLHLDYPSKSNHFAGTPSGGNDAFSDRVLGLPVRPVRVSGAQGTQYTISNIPYGWKVNGSTTNGTYEANEGAKVIFTPANIPAGKKIKSIKVVKQ